MLAYDVSRCAGKLPDSNDDCQRRNGCARYLSRPGPRSPMAWSVCAEFDAYIHAESGPDPAAASHPTQQSPERVLAIPTLRTGEGSA